MIALVLAVFLAIHQSLVILLRLRRGSGDLTINVILWSIAVTYLLFKFYVVH